MRLRSFLQRGIIAPVLVLVPVLVPVLLPFISAQDVSHLLEKANSHHLANPDSCIYYSDQLIDRAPDSLVLKALFLKGWNQNIKGDYGGSITTLKEYMKHPAAIESNLIYIRSVGKIGSGYREQGMYDSAMVYLTEYDRLADKYLGNNTIEAKLELGELYRTIGRMDESDRYKLEAISRARKSGNQTELIMSLYYYLDDHIEEIGTAKYQPYLDEYVELVSKTQLDGTIDVTHAAMLLLQYSDEEKLDRLSNDVQRIEMNGRDKGYLFLNQYLTRQYLEKGLFQKAETAAQNGLETAEIRGDAIYIQQYNKLLGEINEKQSDYEDALRFYSRYHQVKDSTFSNSVLANIDSLKIQFETAQKEQQIADQELRIQKQRNQRNILIVTVVALLWFGGFIVLYLLNRNRLQRRLALQEAEIQDQRILQLEQEKQLLAMNSMIEGQEAERMRIAQDLHDGLGGLLGTIKARFSIIQQEIESLESLDVYSQVNELINTASTEVRRISHNMAPHALRLGTLRDAIFDLASQIRSNELEVDFQWTGDEIRLEQSKQVMLFRIAQELTTNVLKYAKASHLLIQVNCYPGEINMIIEDNGIGFDPKEARSQNGLGLKSVESRVNFLHGTIDIDSQPGHGSSISVQVPV